MTMRDLLELSLYNLYRVRLRTFLTVSGVVIAIAAFVGMLSFGAGNERYVSEMFDELGLFTSMNVYARSAKPTDSVPPLPLDGRAIGAFQEVPGVRMAFPFVSMNVSVDVADTTLRTKARALQPEAFSMALFANLLNGVKFSSDTAREVIVTPGFARMLNMEEPDSLVGQTLIISTRVSSLDSALINVVNNNDGNIFRRLRDIRFDSLFDESYRSRVMRQELSESVKRFMDGFMNRLLTVSDTLTIIGVGGDFRGRHIRMDPVILTEHTARYLLSKGFPLGNDPSTIISVMQQGSIFAPEEAADSRTYPRVTLEIDPLVPVDQIVDSVEALGFRAMSFAQQFKDFQRFITYYYIGLGAVGLIALITAALGIVNTMVMAVIERRREIGVLLSLGADRTQLRWMFLVEAGVIGALGGIFGILFGWIGTRIISAAAQVYMESEGMPVMEPFALPLWLIVTALLFGITISVAAGLYPAARAARVDPVEALRGD